ncbi:MAG TPA: ABC transporter permease subunit [Lachnospiraceae bacterium]|nr:ABC transporter permease subunit [Lachnospiraceae bacterium]
MTHSTINDKEEAGKRRIKLWAVAFWLILWQLSSSLLNQEILLVSPISTGKRLLELIWKFDFWLAIAKSMGKIILGFLIAVLSGILLAMLANLNRALEELLRPLFSVMKAIPVASFIILCLVFIPSRNLSIFTAYIMVLPIIYTNVLQGIQSTDRNLVEMAQVFQITWFRKVRYIFLPAIVPFLHAAGKISIGFSFKSGIAAEVIGIPADTIGENLYQAKVYLNTPDLFAWTIVIIIVSILFERVFLYILDRLLGRVTKRL